MVLSLRYKTFLFTIVWALLISCSESVEVAPTPLLDLSESQNEIVEGIESIYHPMNGTSGHLTENDLLLFNDLKDARMVGIGEATHGTREFFEAKSSLIKNLIDKQGYKALLFEMDFAEALFFNDYVQWKTNEPIEALMKEKMIFWAWKTNEIKNLLTWMRSYNEGLAVDDMVGFYGVDVQFSTYDADMVIETFAQFDPATADYLSLILLPYKNIQSYYADGASHEEFSRIELVVQIASDIIHERKEELIGHIGTEQYQILQRLGIHMIQTAQVRREAANGQFNSRDKLMAENALWYYEFLGDDVQLVLWAHNGHVAKDDVYDGQGSMGFHLTKDLRNLYKTVGFGFSQGSFMAFHENLGLVAHQINQKPANHSSNFVLHHTELSSFIINMKNAQEVVGDWLSTKLPFLSIGSVYNGKPDDYYRNISLGRHFDYLIYFDRVNESEPFY